MEEKIIKILSLHMNNFSSLKKNEIDAAKEITSHVFEFTEWVLANTAKSWKGKYQLIEGEVEYFDTVEELYQYWFTNIKK